jgi:hypothetical protein
VGSGFDPWQGQEDFSITKRLHQHWGAPSPLFNGTGFLSQGKGGRGVKLTTQLYPVYRLRMSGAMPLLPIYVFMTPVFLQRLVLFITSMDVVERFETVLRHQATPPTAKFTQRLLCFNSARLTDDKQGTSPHIQNTKSSPCCCLRFCNLIL